MAASKLEKLGQHEFFASALSPMALLDEDAVFRGVNAAYLDATGSSRIDLLSTPIFEAFPDNPKTPEAHSVQRLRASLERVLRSRRPDHMGFQRYDVPNRAEPGSFVAKTWMPVNTPVRQDGVVIGVLHRVDDVTSVGRPLLMPSTEPDPTGENERLENTTAGSDKNPNSQQWAAVLAEAASLARENRHLRDALESRATIDAAKGMVMLECSCSPDAAFAFLLRISQDTNVRVADVAAALTQHARHGRDQVRDILGLAKSLVEPPG